MSVSDDLVVIGRVVKAHGIRGEVSVHLLTDVPERLAAGTSVVLGGTPTTIVSSRPHQGRLLVAFEGVADRSGAERLRGRDIEAEPIDLDDQEHYFAHELVGMPVVGDDDRELGTVSALIELPGAAGYDLLEVERADGTTWLLPAADELVEVEELEGPGGGVPSRQLRVIDAPEGLVDGEAEIVRSEGELPEGELPEGELPEDGSAS